MKNILRKDDANFLINMSFLYNKVYLNIFDFEISEIENGFFVSINNTMLWSDNDILRHIVFYLFDGL